MTWLRQALFWSLLPWLLPQAWWVRRMAPRFAPAADPRSGMIGGTEPAFPYRLLAMGDSIVDGVGCRTVATALPGRFARQLQRQLGQPVAWQAIGQTGATADQVCSQLLPKLDLTRFDLILLSVGVNDVTGLTGVSRWRKRLLALIQSLQQQSPEAWVVVCGLPPLRGFPLLPQPLRWWLGWRAETLDQMGRRLIEPLDRCVHIPTDFDPSPERFAADGYHPNEASCQVWAEELVTRLEDAGVFVPTDQRAQSAAACAVNRTAL